MMCFIQNSLERLASSDVYSMVALTASSRWMPVSNINESTLSLANTSSIAVTDFYLS